MRVLARIQGAYYIGAGLWPLLSTRSFEAVTGPKTDDWLVHTVAALVAVIGLVLLSGSLASRIHLELFLLATGSAAALALIDIIHSARGTISAVYAADAVVECLLILAWIGALWRRLRPSRVESWNRR